ncbi:hypothetical protein [Deferribacter abyssi]|uniref:hypothetical protein n=1 Tax=Deferribacter abyssi TaxID=213806 RepID=UPI003C26E89F
MWLISVDPSTKEFAISIFKNQKVKRCLKIPADNIVELQRLFNKYSPFLLAIEYQYFFRNPKTLISLVESRTRLETIAFMCGCKGIYRIRPSNWQKLLTDKRLKRAVLKELSLKYAKKKVKKKIDHDIADSICIGFFVYQNFQKLECEVINV